MLNRFFGGSERAPCSQCGHREERQVQPFAQDPLGMMGWFDQQMARMEDELFRNRFFDMPTYSVAFDPERRSRMFDAMFAPAGGQLAPQFRENRANNQLECQLNTGFGEYFKPEDVEVNINGRNVEFKARREERSEDGNNYSVREVRRFFTVPETADAERIEAHMAPNGKLMLTAPLLQPAIEQEKKKDGPVAIKINRK